MNYILYLLILWFKRTRRKVFVVVYKDKENILRYGVPMRWVVAKSYFDTFSDAIAIDFKLSIFNIENKK